MNMALFFSAVPLTALVNSDPNVRLSRSFKIPPLYRTYVRMHRGRYQSFVNLLQVLLLEFPVCVHQDCIFAP